MATLLLCTFRTLTRFPPSPLLKDVLAVGSVRAAGGGPVRGGGEQEAPPPWLHPLALQGQRQHLRQARAQAGGAGLQPGGPGGDGEEVPEERLVQDAAAEADCERGGLPEPHRHQPLLLRPVQLLLHPPAREEGAGVLPVLRLLPAAPVHHAHRGAGLPRPAARLPAPEDPTGQGVPLHIGQRQRVRQAVKPVVPPLLRAPPTPPTPSLPPPRLASYFFLKESS